MLLALPFSARAQQPNVSGAREVKENVPAAARALKLTILPSEVKAADDFGKVFAAIANSVRMDSTCPRVRY